MNNAANEDDIRNGTAYAHKIGIQVTMPKWGLSKSEYFFDSEKRVIAKGLSSIKYMSACLAEEMFEIAHKKKYNKFMDVLYDLNNNSSLKTNQLDILIKIDFFSEFGNQRELLKITELFYDMFKKGQAKQIRKDRVDGTPLEKIVQKYAVGVTKSGGVAKSYTLLDVMSIMHEAEDAVKDLHMNDLSIVAKVRNFADVMGYVGYVSGREEDRKRKEEIFWEIFEERLELCHRALRLRHERLLGTLSDASPIHWQNGGLARLKKGETIDKLLYGGYSTLSLGYAGLYECVKAMTGKSHTDDEAKPFALAIMQKMNDKCAEWKAAENIDYSLYGTPIESTTYKFAKCLQKRFGVIEGITDRNYITNSYHVHVTEKINAFDKLRFESEFQLLSPGGAISYIETANLSNNVEAAIKVIQYIYDHIMYAELNTKSDFCQECGYDGEIRIVENEDGKYIWECPNCGNRDRTKMNIARRTCGYIGVNDFNQGRTQEIKERYVHLGGE